jgi:alcohol dehydrogenase (cytochrome c)
VEEGELGSRSGREALPSALEIGLAFPSGVATECADVLWNLDEAAVPSAADHPESQFISVRSFARACVLGRELMNRSTARMLAGVVIATSPALAAEVTPERLANVDREPQNWLMNHRTYDAQRYSPLDKINKGNVKSLKIVYAVAIGGTSANENLQATPLAEDGFLYVTDQWGVLYKIDGRSGKAGRIVWRMDPGQEKAALANRGAALWGNLVISMANYPPRMIATNKETGKVVWETNLSDGQAEVIFSAAPLAVKDRIVIGASGGDYGVRDFMLAVDAATGKLTWREYVIPAPGEPGSETWKDKNNAWQTGGGAMWVTVLTTSPPIRCFGAPAIQCRCSISATALATIFTPIV